MLSIFAAVAATEAQGPIEQLSGQFGVNVPSLLAQILNFCILAFLLYRFAVKPIVATLDERQAKITDGLKYAEEMKRKLADAQRHHAETMKQAALEAQKVIEEARESAKAHMERQLQETTKQAEDMLKKAQEAIALEHKKMLQEARQELAQLVVQTTSAVLSRDLSQAERASFAESALRELAS